MDWSFFHRVIMLTANSNEYALGAAECERVGLVVQPYHAVREIGPHQSFSHSERNILLEFLYSTDEVLLHLEDDVVFRNLDHLPAALSELPADWDILYLGANLVCWNDGEPQLERFSDHLWRVRAAWTTHAVAYHKKCVEFILGKQPSLNERMFDNALSDLLPELQAFIVAPMVAYQRPRYSMIWGRVDDYTKVFELSDTKLIG